jgi:hypothetical protein
VREDESTCQAISQPECSIEKMRITMPLHFLEGQRLREKMRENAKCQVYSKRGQRREKMRRPMPVYFQSRGRGRER